MENLARLKSGLSELFCFFLFTTPLKSPLLLLITIHLVNDELKIFFYWRNYIIKYYVYKKKYFRRFGLYK